MDIGRVGSLLIDQAPLVAGTLLGAAGALWRQIGIHNSVARYSYTEKETNHQKLRQYFIGVVNGKERMRDQNGEPCAAWNATLLFYVVSYGLAGVLIVGSSFLLSAIKGADDDAMTKQGLYVGEVVAAVIVYVACWRHLRRERHDTLIALETGPEGERQQRWIRLSGLRAEDGLATRDLSEERLTGEPGLLSVVEKA